MDGQRQNTIEYDFKFLESQAGILRICEGVLSLAAFFSALSAVIGTNCSSASLSFFFFIVILSFIQSLVLIAFFVLRLEKFITFANTQLVLLINDCVILGLYFLGSTLIMLTIGTCYGTVTARIFASLFSIANLLTLVGLVYLDYLCWRDSSSKTNNTDTNGTTVTESSPTVLTLR